MPTPNLITTDHLPEDVARDAWAMYADHDRDTDTAVQRHHLTAEEFDHLATDRRITKYLTHHGTRITGVAAAGNDLDAWPLLNPAYFARTWPTHTARHAVFYVGVLCATQNAPDNTYADLGAALHTTIQAVDGIAVMDLSTHAVTHDRAIRATMNMLRRINPNTVGERIDAQQYWAFRFDGEPLTDWESYR